MKWIVITSPDFLSGEALFIDRLFCHGLDVLHLRKPGASYEDCRHLLREIPSRWHNRIVVHEHFSLATEFSLLGIHLNRRCPDVPEGFRGHVSCSCHRLDEVVAAKPHCDYVFLSPIFDSISKQGYSASFTDNDLQQAHVAGTIDHKVVALGGITSSHIPQIKAWGFGGAAFLGDVWSRMNDAGVDEYLDTLRLLL